MNNPGRRRWLKQVAAAPIAGSAVAAAVATSLASAAGTSGEPTVDSTGKIACNPILQHRLRPLMAPEELQLCELFEGQVLLMVNTASKCGFTHQFESLETLHKRYQDQGFQVLGFPSDDFRQELSTEEEVAQFCELNYGVSFPMFQKISVSADTAHPLYHDLAAAGGTYPRWNFNKYLIDRKGQVVSYFPSGEQPLGSRLTGAIEALL